ncbi:MAG: hypothetical protein M3O50_00910 [Myxococcota bacterium]|nr:hypothetical protein [Myxococcota bacterium]
MIPPAARWLQLPGLLALIACRGPTPADDEAPPAASTSHAGSPVAIPADHLAPGELLAGADLAFGIPLPRGTTVAGSFAHVVYASGAFSVHSLAEYFRARVQDGLLREGPSAATFVHVRARGEQQSLELEVRISSIPGGSSIQVRDATPPAAPNLPDEAARWRQVGLAADGRLADPSHLD